MINNKIDKERTLAKQVIRLSKNIKRASGSVALLIFLVT
jgi:hypothetical protein